MTMHASKNGASQAGLEFEATHYSNPETEEEWETPEASPYSNPEMEYEWESHETNPYSNPETEWEMPEVSPYSNPEMEDEAGGFLGGILSSILGEEEALPYSNPEAEWETHEAHPYSNPYSSPEAEWETHEAHPYSSPEAEWETHEAHPYSNPYSSPEAEWETHEASHYSNPEAEWETHEASHYSNPYSSPEAEWETHEAHPYSNPYSSPEAEWETHEASHYSNPEAEWEVDRFFPLLPLAAKFALPFVKKAGMSLVKRLVRRAPNMINNVVRNIMRPGRGGSRFNPSGQSQNSGVPRMRPSFPGAAPSPVRPTSSPIGPGALGGSPGVRPSFTGGYPGRRRRRGSRSVQGQQQTVAGLFRQLSRIFGEGESEAVAHEASFFGANEFEAEIAAHEAAHEAALTEVMAAEASHTESESEAEALLGATLPVTIRIMGARRVLRPVVPTLAQSNARLIQGLHRQGREGRQMLRTVPAIQRRTIASLKAAQRQGRPITPALVSQVMSGQAARVLSNPHICGRSLVRNMAIRQGTVQRPR